VCNVIELPNENWVRGQKQPDWSLCLDPANTFYGWKMYECNGNWVSGNRLTGEEVVKAMSMPSLREHWPKFQALLEYRRTLSERVDE
jgi:hypothetical protein